MALSQQDKQEIQRLVNRTIQELLRQEFGELKALARSEGSGVQTRRPVPVGARATRGAAGTVPPYFQAPQQAPTPGDGNAGDYTLGNASAGQGQAHGSQAAGGAAVAVPPTAGQGGPAAAVWRSGWIGPTVPLFSTANPPGPPGAAPAPGQAGAGASGAAAEGSADAQPTAERSAEELARILVTAHWQLSRELEEALYRLRDAIMQARDVAQRIQALLGKQGEL